MKANILSLITLFFWIPVAAQNFIARAGLTSSIVEYRSNSNLGYNKSHTNSFVIGGAVDFPILKHLAIQPELYFINKGVDQWYETTDVDIESTLKLSYLELSLLAKLRFDGLYFILGPACGFAVGGTYVIETWNDSQNPIPLDTHWVDESKVDFGTDSQDPAHIDKAIDLSAQIGLGYVFKRVQVDFRYGHGLTNIDDNGFFYYEAKNQVFQLTLGYQFPLKRKKADNKNIYKHI